MESWVPYTNKMVDMFPFVLTNCSAVTTDLLDFVTTGIENGLNPSALQNMIKSFYTSKYHMKMMSYYEMAEKTIERGGRRFQVVSFSSFYDEVGYYGRIPSGI